MKKYVQNIKRLYGGQTANAVVLTQVDDQLPKLVPAIERLESSIDSIKDDFKRRYGFSPDGSTLDELNESIFNHNIELQYEFNNSGHSELYMMDDTSTMKPEHTSFDIDKTYVHSINGVTNIDSSNLNTSQLNVLFPTRKMSSKSLYSTTLRLQSGEDIDDKMETSKTMTLQGKVSYEKCLQSVAFVGNNLYMLSSNINLTPSNSEQHIYGNGISLINGIDKAYNFPHSMTLFQPGQEMTYQSTITQFKDWYKKHNHMTVVDNSQIYGSNISILDYIGFMSYGLNIGTYAPAAIICNSSSGGKTYYLDSDTYRSLRTLNGQSDSNNNFYEDGKYSFYNGSFEGNNDSVGFLYNLYDGFISGGDRILKLNIPISSDFNKIKLQFNVDVVGQENLGFEYHVLVNDDEVESKHINNDSNPYIRTFYDMVVNSHDIQIVVRIHYDVDFNRRNYEKFYRELLKGSGVIIKNIQILSETEADNIKNLTFGSYLNQTGIDDAEHDLRYDQFWQVSQYKRNMAYQTVLESSLKNLISSNIEYRNNYSSGDIYGDVFVTKSLMNSAYDIYLREIGRDAYVMSVGRDYIGLGQCSNQLSLVYNPTYIYMKFDDSTDSYTKYMRSPMEGETSDTENQLKFQRVEVVKNINRFDTTIKHKSNVYSVAIQNSNLVTNPTDSEEIQKYKEQLRDSITQFVRNVCQDISPVHTQLFDVQFI